MAERSSWFHDPDRVRLRSESLGRAIQERRAELGLSRPELARRASLSYPYVAELETGKKQGSPSTLHALASALDLETHELLARAERELSQRDVAPHSQPPDPSAAATETGEGPPKMLSLPRLDADPRRLDTDEPLTPAEGARPFGWSDAMSDLERELPTPPQRPSARAFNLRRPEERLYDLTEIAAEIGVRPATLDAWESRGTNAMPPPNQRLSTGPVWFASRIEPWIAEQRRRSEFPAAEVDALVRRTARRAFRLAAVLYEDPPRVGTIYRRGAELTALEGHLSRLMRSDEPTLGSLLTPLGAVAAGIAEIGRLIDEIPEEMRKSRAVLPLPTSTERAIAGLKDALGSAVLSWLPAILSQVERHRAQRGGPRPKAPP
jgi:transcriptional regulator with XRE-family HTH domain